MSYFICSAIRDGTVHGTLAGCFFSFCLLMMNDKGELGGFVIQNLIRYNSSVLRLMIKLMEHNTIT